MNKERDPYKEEAQMALAKGDWKRPWRTTGNIVPRSPRTFESCVKIGELLERLGRKKEAVLVYREAAEAYAKDGFLLQAISLNKMILRIDPSAREINDRLAQLYQEKTREAKPFRPLPPIPLFSELKEKELQSLLERVQVKTFSKEDFICREGEAGDSLDDHHSTERPRSERKRPRIKRSGSEISRKGIFSENLVSSPIKKGMPRSRP